MSPSLYFYMMDCKTYDGALKTLQAVFVKPTSEVFVCHRFATRKQQGNKSADQYVLAPKLMAKYCVFKTITAEQYAEEDACVSFISGFSSVIRQQLLEKPALTFEEVVQQAGSLELVQHNSNIYCMHHFFSACHSTTVSISDPWVPIDSEEVSASAKTIAATKTRFYCGHSLHSHYTCPAWNATCHKSGKKGHFTSVCQA